MLIVGTLPYSGESLFGLYPGQSPVFEQLL